MADFDYKQSAGATLSVGDTSSPVSYTVVGGITNIPEFGRSYERGTFNPVGDRRTRKYKGAYDEGSFSVELARDVSDSGQTALQTAVDSDEPVPIKIELGDAPSGSGTTGTTFEFDALIMSFTTAIGTTSDFVSGTVQMETLLDRARLTLGTGRAWDVQATSTQITRDLDGRTFTGSMTLRVRTQQ